MIEHIYYIVKSRLHYFPPCVSQIMMLKDLGCNITVLYGSSEIELITDLRKEGIECVKLKDPRGRAPGRIDKILNWIGFRSALSKYLKKIDESNSILWFGNAETLLPMKGKLKKYKYVVMFLELLDTMPLRLLALKRMAQNASAVMTCEETRSYLMQYWFKLKKLPYTIPNKPYQVAAVRGNIPTTIAGKKIMKKINGRKYLIYQGIFQNFEYLKIVAEVMKKEFPNYCIVMMGIDRNHIVNCLKEINPNVIYSDYIPAPKHLEVTANADVGLLFYHPDSLNKAFCAPNKIFEYAYFGLPILGNNIPGLKNTIGASHAGECIEFNYANVSTALHSLIENRATYSDNAVNYYKSVDNKKTVLEILSSCNVKNVGEVYE